MFNLQTDDTYQTAVNEEPLLGVSLSPMPQTMPVNEVLPDATRRERQLASKLYGQGFDNDLPYEAIANKAIQSLQQSCHKYENEIIEREKRLTEAEQRLNTIQGLSAPTRWLYEMTEGLELRCTKQTQRQNLESLEEELNSTTQELHQITTDPDARRKAVRTKVKDEITEHRDKQYGRVADIIEQDTNTEFGTHRGCCPPGKYANWFGGKRRLSDGYALALKGYADKVTGKRRTKQTIMLVDLDNDRVPASFIGADFTRRYGGVTVNHHDEDEIVVTAHRPGSLDRRYTYDKETERVTDR